MNRFLSSIHRTADERMFHKMGYFTDQSGIMNRYERERKHWDAHLNNTKAFAIQAMQGKGNKKAAVLGSGWLLDVPIEELSRSFETVSLFDVKHPAEVKKKAAQMGNVQLHVCDISGFARPVYEYTKNYRVNCGRTPIDTIEYAPSINLSDFDFVFSCNILNQLDILLVDYLLEDFDLHSEETLAFRKKVQAQHIAILPTGKSCLVSDYEEITYSWDNVQMSAKMLVENDITKRPDARKWVWEFDTQMTYHKDRKTFFNVLGVNI